MHVLIEIVNNVNAIHLRRESVGPGRGFGLSLIDNIFIISYKYHCLKNLHPQMFQISKKNLNSIFSLISVQK